MVDCLVAPTVDCMVQPMASLGTAATAVELVGKKDGMKAAWMVAH